MSDILNIYAYLIILRCISCLNAYLILRCISCLSSDEYAYLILRCISYAYLILRCISSLSGHGRLQYNYMPREKVLAIRTHFDRLDADGNGSLDIHEMIPLARSMGVTTIEPSLLKNLVRTIDIDGDGQISFSEVMAFLIVQEYYFNRNKERSAQSLQNRRRRKEAQANLNGPNAQRLYKETTQGLTQENGCGLSMVDESIRHMIFSVVSLIGIQNPDLTKEQRSKLNIITKYEKLLQVPKA
ncbi:hypothetical protein AAMO2058_001648200 [Amorphochlora amoebiformis]